MNPSSRLYLLIFILSAILTFAAGIIATGEPASEEAPAADSRVYYVNVRGAVEAYLRKAHRKLEESDEAIIAAVLASYSIRDESGYDLSPDDWEKTHPFNGLANIEAIYHLRVRAGGEPPEPVLTERRITYPIPLTAFRSGWRVGKDVLDGEEKAHPHSIYSSNGLAPIEKSYLSFAKGSVFAGWGGDRSMGPADLFAILTPGYHIRVANAGFAELKIAALSQVRLVGPADLWYNGPYIPDETGVPVEGEKKAPAPVPEGPGRISADVGVSGRLFFNVPESKNQIVAVRFPGGGENRFLLLATDAEFEIDTVGNAVKVYRGSVSISNQDGSELRVQEGSAASLAENGGLDTGLFDPATPAAPWLDAPNFSAARNSLEGGTDGTYDLTRLDWTTGRGSPLAKDEGDPGRALDGNLRTRIRFLAKDKYYTYGKGNFVVRLDDPQYVDEAILHLGISGAQGKVGTISYSLRVSDTGDFKGEEILVQAKHITIIGNDREWTAKEIVPIESRKVKYVRLDITENNGQEVCLYEIRLRSLKKPFVAGGVWRTPRLMKRNWALAENGAKPYAEGLASRKYNLGNAIDGNLVNGKVVLSGQDSFFDVRFDAPHVISQVNLYVAMEIQRKGAVRYALEGSLDGVWGGEEILLGAGSFGYGAGRRKYEHPLEKPVNLKFIRYRIVSSELPPSTLFEIEALGGEYFEDEPAKPEKRPEYDPGDIFKGRVCDREFSATTKGVLAPDGSDDETGDSRTAAAAFDGDRETYIVFSGANANIVLDFKGDVRLSSAIILAGTAGTAGIEDKPGIETGPICRATYLISASSTGDFAGEEVVIGRGYVEGSDLGRFSHMCEYVPGAPVVFQFLKFELTRCKGSGLKLYEFALEIRE